MARFGICRATGIGAVAALAALVAPATAQTSPPVADDAGQLQDIVVTAERRETKLQKTPIAVSAFTADDLRQQNAPDITAIAAQTPNAEFSIGSSASGSPNVSAVFVRGIGQTDFLSTTDPGVGLYVDGFYVSRQVGNVLDLQDVARIEVLRGPQGTLFGKNTVGGAINVVTTTPGPDLVARGEVTYGSYNRVEVRDTVSGPLADGLFAKAAIAYKRVDGYGDRLSYPGGQVTGTQGGLDDVIGRFGLRAVPSEDLTVDFSFDFIRNRDDSVVNQGLLSNPGSPLLGLYNTFAGTPYTRAYANPGRYDNYETGPNFSHQDIFGGSLTVQFFPLPNLAVKLIMGYRHTSSSICRDADGASPVVLDAVYGLEDYEASEELQFSGTLFDGRRTWLGGL